MGLGEGLSEQSVAQCVAGFVARHRRKRTAGLVGLSPKAQSHRDRRLQLPKRDLGYPARRRSRHRPIRAELLFAHEGRQRLRASPELLGCSGFLWRAGTAACRLQSWRGLTGARAVLAIRPGEAPLRVSCPSGRSSGQPARTDVRSQHDAPRRARQLLRRPSTRRAVRNPQSSRGTQGQARQVAPVRKGATSSRYSKAARAQFCLDATTGQADRRR
jgi:hypothetical protein